MRWEFSFGVVATALLVFGAWRPDAEAFWCGVVSLWLLLFRII